MAILMQQQKQKTNWFAVLVFLFLIAVIFGGGYFLFFSPTPGIDIIIPTPLVSAEKISKVTIDSAQIINNPVLKNLRHYGTTPSAGNVGRQNPFMGF